MEKLITKREMFLFSKLYEFRVLSTYQCYFLCYKDVCEYNAFVKNKLIPLKKQGFITVKTSNSGEVAIQLTNKGIDSLRQFRRIPKEVFDEEKQRIVKTYLTESDLFVSPKQISHQLALSQFVIDFDSVYKKKKKESTNYLPYKYYDEKYISKFEIIRPDGLIEIGNIYLFLEQDMGTESRKQLNEKWNRYRRFLSVSRHTKENKKIIVLFIVDCEESQLLKRKDLIRNTISTVFIDLLSDSFDIYIGSKKEILMACFNKLIPLEDGTYKNKLEKPIRMLLEKRNFFMVDKDKFSKVINTGGAKYGGYIRKLNQNGKIVVENKRIQEFLYDEYYFEPVSVLSKIEYARRSSSLFYTVKRRGIDYLVVTNHIKGLFYHLKSADLLTREGVFYTTVERLKTMSFPNALFVFDKEGNLYHCINSSYLAKKFEYNILS